MEPTINYLSLYNNHSVYNPNANTRIPLWKTYLRFVRAEDLLLAILRFLNDCHGETKSNKYILLGTRVMCNGCQTTLADLLIELNDTFQTIKVNISNCPQDTQAEYEQRIGWLRLMGTFFNRMRVDGNSYQASESKVRVSELGLRDLMKALRFALHSIVIFNTNYRTQEDLNPSLIAIRFPIIANELNCIIKVFRSIMSMSENFEELTVCIAMSNIVKFGESESVALDELSPVIVIDPVVHDMLLLERGVNCRVTFTEVIEDFEFSDYCEDSAGDEM